MTQDLMATCSKNLGTMLAERTAAGPDKIAFLVPDRAPQGPNQWNPVTWGQVQQQAHELAAGLLGAGITPEARVAIAMTTRIEWVLVDLAIACSGGATTTIYPNTQQDDVSHIIKDSASRIVVAENAAQLAKFVGHRELEGEIDLIVLVEDDRNAPTDTQVEVISLDQLAERGRAKLAADSSLVTRTIDAIESDSLSTLIYTSGTTGRPKGVELTHGAWTFEGASMNTVDIVYEDDLQYLWLPLSHVFGKCLLAVQLAVGFATAIDGRIDRIVTGLGEVKPTFMCGAPRIFEKVRIAVLTKSAPGSLAGRIAQWAFAVGRDSRPYRLEGRPMPKALAVKYAIADKLVFSKLKATMGGRMRFFMSGSAKLSEQVQAWFYSAGLTVVEGYGATEISAIASVNNPKTPRFGTVGTIAPGLQVRIAEDGEVLFKGPSVMRGYHGIDDSDVLVDGWYHTGDIGELDDEGYLSITDRKKDLIKTSGGKYVAPQKVEAALTTNIQYVSQAIVLGEGHKFVVALLTLDPAQVEGWAQRHGKSGLSYSQLVHLPELRASIDRRLAEANQRLERWETVKRYAILDSELGVADGGVTPNMKVRRTEVQRQYADIIADLYADEQGGA